MKITTIPEEGIVSSNKSTTVEVIESASMLTIKELQDADSQNKSDKTSTTQKPDPMDRVFAGPYKPSILLFYQAESMVY